MSIAKKPFDPAVLIEPTLPPAQPELRLVAVMSLAGAASIEGTSGSLGNEIDGRILTGVRAWSDVVLVGGGTVRAEDYGGVQCSDQDKAARARRGQAAVPPIAVITKSFDFDTSTQLFTDTEVPPIFLAPQASIDDPNLADARSSLESSGARIISTGDGSAQEIVDALRNAGFNRITCEGGPGLYGMLLSAGLGDIIHLTIDPTIHGNIEKTLFGAGGDYSATLELEDIRVSEDSMMFCRFRRVRD